MKEIIDLKNLMFSYKNKVIFENFDLEIKPGEWVSIVGPNGSGKSTLLKLIVGLIQGSGIIQINGKLMNGENVMSIRRNVGVVFSNPDNTFVAETVADELAFPLENLELSAEEIKEKINSISKKLKLTKLLEENPHKLSGGQKQLVALGVALITNPKLLMLDEALCMLDDMYVDTIIKYLKKLHKSGMTIVNITHDMDETVYGDRIVVINSGKKVIDGNTMAVYREEKILNRIGLRLPFMIDLSYKLKFYGLIEDDYTDMKDLVNTLWK
jgi:energy-coupling factor transport system ATP-binding protein